MLKIDIGYGEFILIDDEDFSRVNRYTWCCGNGRSICATVAGVKVNLARYLLNDCIKPYRAECIDHIDGNPFNNQKINLRPATKEENARNRPILKTNTVGFPGVYFDTERRMFVAKIRLGSGKRKFLGRFVTSESAANAYKVAALKFHGEFACRSLQ